MKNVGFIGWRGMVGSVLMQRMIEEAILTPSARSSSPLPSSGKQRPRSAVPLRARFRTPLIWKR